jgi:acetyl/propionyl-CoA carboxylase alpha subunit
MALGPVLAIANRGEIAIRIARTAEALGWQPVVLLGDPDLQSLAARTIGRVERIGAAGSELDPALVVAAAVRAGAVALHPGYGFLSERPDLAQACIDAGIAFVGPSPETLALCGDKIATRDAATRAGVPILTASAPLTLDDRDRWQQAGDAVGYPLIVKVAGGGGGRGLRVARSASHLSDAIESALREAGASAAGTRVYLERYLEGARHVEVQVAGNGEDAVALGDRDCSIQRRHQKVIEEAPAFGLSESLRESLHDYAVAITREVRLRGLGTIEFLLGRDGALAFMEINPRLQVEHTVTEEVTGLDLVEIQLDLIEEPTLPEPVEPHGHAMQARLYAEDPTAGFVPSPGEIRVLAWPHLPNLRVDAGYAAGDTVPSFYDPLVAKIITWGLDREAALDRLAQTIACTRLAGIATNRPWLGRMLENPEFRTARHDLTIADTIRVDVQPPPDAELASIALTLLPPADAKSAWESSGPFRIASNAVQPLHGQDASWQRRIAFCGDCDHWSVLIEQPGESQPTYEQAEPVPGIVTIATDEGWEISSAAGRWEVQLGPLRQQHESVEQADGILRAPMPGTVVAVNAQAGQPVAQGDVLAVMVAMKIELTLAAPFDGTVASVSCKPGDLVSTRQALVSVAPDQTDDAATQSR